VYGPAIVPDFITRLYAPSTRVLATDGMRAVMRRRVRATRGYRGRTRRNVSDDEPTTSSS